ncbi:hypothetical protein C0995_004374 [Termitomyces sp. Mi166|nr:hypothetical protein C0995_004374 [Termitomyces sp. Mi166\
MSNPLCSVPELSSVGLFQECSEEEEKKVWDANVGVQTEENEAPLIRVALSSPIRDGQDALVQQGWLIEHMAIEQALEVICTHHTLLNTTTQSTGAIHNGLVQSRHPILFEVNAELEDLGQAIVLHRGILYQWQHSLECLALKPIAYTPAPEDITDEI